MTAGAAGLKTQKGSETPRNTSRLLRGPQEPKTKGLLATGVSRMHPASAMQVSIGAPLAQASADHHARSSPACFSARTCGSNRPSCSSRCSMPAATASAARSRRRLARKSHGSARRQVVASAVEAASPAKPEVCAAQHTACPRRARAGPVAQGDARRMMLPPLRLGLAPAAAYASCCCCCCRPPPVRNRQALRAHGAKTRPRALTQRAPVHACTHARMHTRAWNRARPSPAATR